MKLFLLAASASALSSTSWQKRLDRAVLDVDLSVEQRVRNLQRVVQATPEVLSDVRSAVDAVRVKGFAEGHVEFLDTLFPVGTTARSDLEGLQALRKQVPEVRAALRTQAAPSAPPAVDSAEATIPVEIAAIIDGSLAVSIAAVGLIEAAEALADGAAAVPAPIDVERLTPVQLAVLIGRAASSLNSKARAFTDAIQED